MLVKASLAIICIHENLLDITSWSKHLWVISVIVSLKGACHLVLKTSRFFDVSQACSLSRFSIFPFGVLFPFFRKTLKKPGGWGGCCVYGVDTVWTTWEIPMASWTVTSPLEKTWVTRKGVKNFQLEGLEDLVCWYVLCIVLSFKKGWIFQKLLFTVCFFFSFLSLVFVFLFQGGSDEYHCEGLERMNSDRSLLSSPAAKRNSERAGLPHAGPPRFV